MHAQAIAVHLCNVVRSRRGTFFMLLCYLGVTTAFAVTK